MLDSYTQLLDLIFPPHPSVKKLRGVTPPMFNCHYDLIQTPFAYALSSYQDELVNAAITANKFHNSKAAAHLLAGLLHTYLASLPHKKTWLVPIPLSAKRERERGFNQVQRVLELVNYPDTTVTSLIKKVKETPPQTALGRQERLNNPKGAFVIRKDVTIPKNHRLILLDDVITTGATMKAARATLARHLPPQTELICIGLAH